MNRIRAILCVNSLLFCALLCAPLAHASTLVGENAQFHYIEKLYDRNGDGRADRWVRSSYNGDAIFDMRDNNWDGAPDDVQERFTIKNVVIAATDADFDRHPESVLYLFPKKAFFVVDADGDGVYDRLDISDAIHQPGAVITQNTREIPIQFLCDTSITSLLQILENKNLAESLAYVRGAITEKHEELSELLKKALQDKMNAKLWSTLVDKTRVYLDLPNNDVAPLYVELMEQKNTQVGASYVSPNKMIINVAYVTTIEEWLEIIDHEFTHMIQKMRIFSHFRSDGLSWKTYAQNPNNHFSPFVEALNLYSAIHFYLEEAEAYLHNGRRHLYYTASLKPSLGLCVQLKRAEKLASCELNHFVSAQDLRSPHQKALFGYISETLKETPNEDISFFDQKTRNIIQNNVESCVQLYERLGLDIFHGTNDNCRDFWAQDQKAYIQFLENILLKGR